MNSIPKISDDEMFKTIDEQSGYYISNYKRIYNINSKRFIKIDKTRFKNSIQQHIAIPIGLL